ncbi:MAG TPA: hypothetical protein VHF89_07555 [Solirubrobacteraceae bacterium]|nr:hypothetical protein [Solirubrobacteraceae bacterium]
MTARNEFLVGGAPPDTLAHVLDAVLADPEIDVVQVQGEEGAPSLLVVSTSDEHAERLRTDLEGRATVEPNIEFEL